MDWKDITIEELTSERPDLVDNIKEVFQNEHDEQNELAEANKKIEDLEKENTTKNEENKTLQTKIDEYEVKEKLEAKRVSINKKIEEAKLPDEAVTEIFMETLEHAEDEDIDKLIADRKILAEAGKGKIKNMNTEDPDKTKKESKLPTVEDLEKAVE